MHLRRIPSATPLVLFMFVACGSTERSSDDEQLDSAGPELTQAPPSPVTEPADPSVGPPDAAVPEDAVPEGAVPEDATPGSTIPDDAVVPLPAEPTPPLDPNCSRLPPMRPTIVTPANNAFDMSRENIAFTSAPFVDPDGDALAAAEFEVREFTGESDPPLVWYGSSEEASIHLSQGTFAEPEKATLDFDKQYSLTVRHVDSSACNTTSEWSLPILFSTSDGSAELYDPSVVRSIEIHIPTENGPPSSWDAIEAQAEAEECVAIYRDYYEGSVTFDGVTYDGVGIRTKGGCGSSRSLDEKASFKVNFEWDPDPTDDVCPESRRIFGKKTLTLNAGVQDTTAMHEHLTYTYYRDAGVPAPRTAAIQVTVNGVYYGVYQNIETIDRKLMNRFFDTSRGRGMMYEGAYRCDFFNGNDTTFEDGHCWDRDFNLDACDGTPGPLDDLQYFEADGVTPQDPWQFAQGLYASLDAIQTPEAFYPGIQSVLDWDAFLTYWATSAVVVDWDNYIYNQNNFRMYHDPGTGLWHFLPWGVDQTWVNRTTGGGRTPFAIMSPRGDIAQLCLNATGVVNGNTCADDLVAKLAVAVAQLEETDWAGAIDEWQARLDPMMQLPDDRKSYDYDEWLEAVEGLRQFAAARGQAVRDELSEAGYSL